MDYGPQFTKDPPFRQRMRFHQSWYRAQVLNVPYGVGPKRKSKVEYGNYLREIDGNNGLNFLMPHIFQIAKRRLAQKNTGIDEFHLLNNLLSSQTMCFNLIGPLLDHMSRTARFLSSFVPEQIGMVNKVALEFDPQPIGDYLNDRSSFNAYISYEFNGGENAFLGIETRLCGPLPDKVFANQHYLKWTHSPVSPWPETSWPLLYTPRFNHLWRAHLLAVALKCASPLGFSTGRLLFVYHPFDAEMKELIDGYQELLKPGDQTFIAMPLDQLVERWKAVLSIESEAQWLGDFSQRYLDLWESEAEYLRTFNPLRRDSTVTELPID